jgi:hypothetical protein
MECRLKQSFYRFWLDCLKDFPIFSWFWVAMLSSEFLQITTGKNGGNYDEKNFCAVPFGTLR